MKTVIIYILSLFILIPVSISSAEDKVGTVNALRGKGNILRLEKVLEAKIKDNILRIDTVETLKDSRIKLLFIDDSLLTLGENSRLIVKEYIESTKEKRGQSIYYLLDGKMRALSGKTRFEVHTPTAVAAARGTYFIVWVEKTNPAQVTGVIVIDGEVDLRNIIDTIGETVIVREGYLSYVREGEPPTKPVKVPPEILRLMLSQTDIEDVIEVLLPLLPPSPLYLLDLPLVPPVTDMNIKPVINLNISVW